MNSGGTGAGHSGKGSIVVAASQPNRAPHSRRDRIVSIDDAALQRRRLLRLQSPRSTTQSRAPKLRLLPTLLFSTQGLYYIAAGFWPLLYVIPTTVFPADGAVDQVTQLSSMISAVIGTTLVVAAWQGRGRRFTADIWTLSALAAAGFIVLDLRHALGGAPFPPTIVADLFVEGTFLLLLGVTRLFAAGRLNKPTPLHLKPSH